MNAIAPQAAAATPWHAALREWPAGEGRAWIFVAKTIVAAMLALWIAFRIGLDSPRTAMLTVFIVAQPQTGLVLAKGFYRAAGTLVGCAATLILLSLFAQQRELFLGTLALWIGLCTAGATRARNFRAYGFVLAGYTACLIGLPATQHPEMSFAIAVTRVSEVLLGIFCAGVVSDLLLPQTLGSSLIVTVRGSYRDFARFVVDALQGRLDHAAIERAHDGFLAQVIAFEAQRDAAYFESPETRLRSSRFRLLNADFMTATTGIHLLHQFTERLRRRHQQSTIDRLTPLYAALAEVLLPVDGQLPAMAAEARPLLARLAGFLERLPTLIAEAGAGLDEAAPGARLDFDCAANLLQRFAEDMQAYTESYISLISPGDRLPRPAPPYVAHGDRITAALAGLRATAVLLVVSAFWIGTAWPSGIGAVIIACTLCCLFAALPAPVLAARGLTIGFVAGLAASFICGLLVLPQLDGFALLVAGMAPFIMVGAWLIANPRTAGIGAGYCLMFGSTIGLDNVSRYDPALLLNEGFAALLGALIATAAFALIVPAGTRRLRLHLTRSLRRQVLLACFEPETGLRHRFENSTRDLLGQLLAGADRGSGEDRALLARAMAVLEAGRAVIDLRDAATIGTLRIDSRSHLNAAVRAVARLFQKPDPRRRQQALAGIDSAGARIDQALDASDHDADERQALNRGRTALHLLRGLLLDDDSYAALSSLESSLETPSLQGAADAT
ncbi:FUSC family protein [Nevskia ramosa]|uniref:FUSC family protein n=1 Tax=Nevskia ramosa TaxID=64002 RepID=UPI0003B792EB|nr:FUSC family protein [Nevskia ramosa]